MESAPPPPPFDRAAHLRADRERVAALRRDAAARVLPVWRGTMPLDDDARPVLAAGPDAQEMLRGADPAVLLGLLAGAPVFAVDISTRPGDDDGPDVGLPGAFTTLRRAAARLRPEDWALLGAAQALSQWHARARFCGACGAETVAVLAGWGRLCGRDECTAEHFPRTDPAMIVLVTHGGRALLGRQRTWPGGLYSCLAGFVEPGESLEQTVAREVFEETGVRLVAPPRYVASQPWPFPSSLMVAFTAEAADDAITVDEVELADAGWFSRADVRAFADAGRFLPHRGTIARRLIEDWLAGA